MRGHWALCAFSPFFYFVVSPFYFFFPFPVFVCDVCTLVHLHGHTLWRPELDTMSCLHCFLP